MITDERRRRTAVLTLAVLAASPLAACAAQGGDEARIERERTQAAESARQQEQIKQLQEKVQSGNAQGGTAAQGGAAVSAVQGQAPAQARPPAVTSGDAGQSGGRVPDSGTYSGVGEQRTLAGTRLDKSYGVEMTFSAGGSTVRYPALGCAGMLQPSGFDGGRRVYAEHITQGHCDDGTWIVAVESSDALNATYRPGSGRYVVASRLTK